VVALARSEESIPSAASLGGAVHELKWDGYRIAAVRDEVGVRFVVTPAQGSVITYRLTQVRLGVFRAFSGQ